MKGLRSPGGPDARDPLSLSRLWLRDSGRPSAWTPPRARTLRRVPGPLSADPPLPPPPVPSTPVLALPLGGLAFGAPYYPFTWGRADATPWHPPPILGRFPQEAPAPSPASLRLCADPNGGPPRTSVPSPVPWPPFARVPPPRLRLYAGSGLLRDAGARGTPAFSWRLRDAFLWGAQNSSPGRRLVSPPCPYPVLRFLLVGSPPSTPRSVLFVSV